MRRSARFAAVMLAGALSLSLAVAVSAAKRAGGSNAGHIAAAISPAWFGRLNLTSDQQTKLNAANTALRAELEKARSLSSPDDKKAAVRQARQTYRQTLQATLTADQIAQLKALAAAARQYHGLGPIGVRLAALDLTDLQQTKLQEIATKYQPDLQKLHASLKDAADKPAVRAQIHALQQKMAEEARALLTPEQIAQLNREAPVRASAR